MTKQLNVKPRTIFCRDNLDILQGINSDCIDLIYLDPPFNKKKVFTAPIGSSAEGAEFSDIFREEDIKDEWVSTIRYENYGLYNYLHGVKEFSNKYNYCYLVYMAIRLIECHRILKDTGSVYLHCDPTMSHYLKIVMDCIFGEKNFRNEIIWSYQGTGESKYFFKRKHDVILFYSKYIKGFFSDVGSSENISDFSKSKYNKEDTKGKYKEIKHSDGKVYKQYIRQVQRMRDVWEIPIINAMAKERTDYPTQKPLTLLERIITASSNKGDIVLDPFCGCATTCIAAEKLERKWIGVDVSHKAYELVKERLKKEVTLFQPKEPHYSTTPPKRGKHEPKEKGYVYIISNNAWQGKYKVGIAKDVTKRLNNYQTSDPLRGYQIEYKKQTPYFKEIEKMIHDTLPNEYEWVSASLKTITDKINKYKSKE